MPSLPSKSKTFVVAAKNYSKFLDPIKFCLISLLCPINFFRDCTHLLSDGYLKHIAQLCD